MDGDHFFLFLFLFVNTFTPVQVCVEGRLYLEFMFDEMMRIKTWHFSIRQHRELIPRSILAMHVSSDVHVCVVFMLFCF